jgi:DNA-binding Lrp family transcriptional regulator
MARRVRLTTPAVIERVRKLEDAGIILGYHAEERSQDGPAGVALIA